MATQEVWLIRQLDVFAVGPDLVRVRDDRALPDELEHCSEHRARVTSDLLVGNRAARPDARNEAPPGRFGAPLLRCIRFVTTLGRGCVPSLGGLRRHSNVWPADRTSCLPTCAGHPGRECDRRKSGAVRPRCVALPRDARCQPQPSPAQRRLTLRVAAFRMKRREAPCALDFAWPVHDSLPPNTPTLVRPADKTQNFRDERPGRRRPSHPPTCSCIPDEDNRSRVAALV